MVSCSFLMNWSFEFLLTTALAPSRRPWELAPAVAPFEPPVADGLAFLVVRAGLILNNNFLKKALFKNLNNRGLIED